MIPINLTKKEIINYIVAENEGIAYSGKVRDYLRAFSGTFSPGMPFTFYFLSVTRPIMYVYDPQRAEQRSSRVVFHQECDKKKPDLLEITNFFEYLTEKEYVRRSYKGLKGRSKLPERYDLVWRKYSDFYSNMMAGLSFVCLADFLPKLKLYKLWKTITK
jgi:hypothetical protein